MVSGAPDYKGEFWRGGVYHRVRLKGDESMRGMALLLTDIPSAFPWRKAPLASGSSQKAIDVTTGLEDTTIPEGYTWAYLSYWWSFDQPFIAYEYLDDEPMTALAENSFVSHYEHDIGLDYWGFDPTGVSSHTRCYEFTNLGAQDMKGYFSALFMIIEAGTERSETKMVKCSFCGAQREVNRRATKVRCPECGQVSFYWPQLFGEKEKALAEVI